jgi:hypothetical protein
MQVRRIADYRCSKTIALINDNSLDFVEAVPPIHFNGIELGHIGTHPSLQGVTAWTRTAPATWIACYAKSS